MLRISPQRLRCFPLNKEKLILSCKIKPRLPGDLIQAIYEYQTLICNIFQMDVSTAFLYDGKMKEII